MFLHCQHLVCCSKSDLFPFPPRAGTKYSVAVFGMFEGGQSTPLAGEERTTLSDAPDLPFPDSSGKTRTFTKLECGRFCRTSFKHTHKQIVRERLPASATAAELEVCLFTNVPSNCIVNVLVWAPVVPVGSGHGG